MDHRPKPRVLVVDDVLEVRVAVAKRLRARNDWAVELADCPAAAHVEAPLDGALVDLCLGDGCGTDVLRALREEHPSAALSLFTGETPSNAQLDRTSQAGAIYIRKPASEPKLSGWEDMVQRTFLRRVSPIDYLPGAHELSPRVRLCLELFMEHRSIPCIAAELELSRNTVRGYLDRAQAVLGAKGRRELRAMLDAAKGELGKL